MPLVAEVIDAVIGGDTHRGIHTLEMTATTGVAIATTAIDNDECGFADALAWIAEHTPGSRVVLGLEGTRSYGVGLARAVQAALRPSCHTARMTASKNCGAPAQDQSAQRRALTSVPQPQLGPWMAILGMPSSTSRSFILAALRYPALTNFHAQAEPDQ